MDRLTNFTTLNAWDFVPRETSHYQGPSHRHYFTERLLVLDGRDLMLIFAKALFEPRHEEACLRGFRLGPTQTAGCIATEDG